MTDKLIYKDIVYIRIMINLESQQNHADRVFCTVRNIGFEHPVNLEGFDDGVKIIHHQQFRPLYEEELKALLNEFNNAILDNDGLALYDN